MRTGDRSPVPSGRASLLAALACAGATLLLLRLGSGHTQASRRFAALPGFQVWVWIYAAEVGAAAALGIAAFPAFRCVADKVGRRAALGAVAVWPVLGSLVVVFGPRAVGEIPLWLGDARTIAVNVIAGLFVTPSFAGLLLVQTRTSALRREMRAAVADGAAGALVVELAWLRVAMLRFLATFATTITLGLLALGALRATVLAFGTPVAQVEPLRLLTYGGVLAAITGLIFVPAYVAWRDRVLELRDSLHPVPGDGRPSHEWFQARDDFDALMAIRPGAASVLATAFGVLAPLWASVVSALLSPSQ